MLRLLQQLLGSEKGQALPMVLAVLAIGGLTIVPSLSYATNVLKSSRTIDEKVKGFNAAGAGVEYACWGLIHGGWSLPENEPQNEVITDINGMSVNITTVNKGQYTLIFGEMTSESDGPHTAGAEISGEFGEYNDEEEAWEYTITLTWTGPGNLRPYEVGVAIPVDFTYKPNSADIDGNMSEAEPVTKTGQPHVLKWAVSGVTLSNTQNPPPYSYAYQTFYITGSGSQVGDYTWARCGRGQAVGTVGEIIGTWYKITSTATRPADNRTTGKIASDIMIQGTAINLVSWQISN